MKSCILIVCPTDQIGRFTGSAPLNILPSVKLETKQNLALSPRNCSRCSLESYAAMQRCCPLQIESPVILGLHVLAVGSSPIRHTDR